ncbi:hypothetical protein KC866_01485 [Patescibacteria group bacterium]|nr:hypothetical protein [Patescibacteria group bacterium]
MEYNEQHNQQEQPIIREKKTSSMTLWYWIVGIVLLVLAGWYAYSAGWFNTRTIELEGTLPVELNGGTGNGALPLNAAPIDSVVIETSEGFPVQQTVVVSGNLPDGCTYLNDPVQLRDGNVFYITLDTRREGDTCTEALVPYETRIDLQVNNLPRGVYVVNVNQREISFELESDNELDFSAGSEK